MSPMRRSLLTGNRSDTGRVVLWLGQPTDHIYVVKSNSNFFSLNKYSNLGLEFAELVGDTYE